MSLKQPATSHVKWKVIFKSGLEVNKTSVVIRQHFLASLSLLSDGYFALLPYVLQKKLDNDDLKRHQGMKGSWLPPRVCSTHSPLTDTFLTIHPPGERPARGCRFHFPLTPRCRRSAPFPSSSDRPSAPRSPPPLTSR